MKAKTTQETGRKKKRSAKTNNERHVFLDDLALGMELVTRVEERINLARSNTMSRSKFLQYRFTFTLLPVDWLPTEEKGGANKRGL